MLVILLIAGGVLLLGALIALAFWLGRRGRVRRPPQAKEQSPAAAWREIMTKLPRAAKTMPIVVVLGGRGSGKSRLIRSVFAARTGFAGEAITARDDASVSAFAPGPLLIQEVSGDLFESEGYDALIRLRDLWRPVALRIALVVFVGPAQASPDRQAQRIRRVLDLLTDLRGGSPPRCCLSVTRVDESTEGFMELVASAREVGVKTEFALAVSSATELQAIWEDRFTDCYYVALAQLPVSEFQRVIRFPEQSGPELARYTETLLRGVLKGPTHAGSTLLALAALPEGSEPALFGDPFAPDEERLEDDRRLLERRRTTRTAGVCAAAGGLIVALYAWHYDALERASDLLTAFRSAAIRARSSERRLRSTLIADPEVQAASAIDSVLSPLYPPLRLAFPRQKSTLVRDFLRLIREASLDPLATAPDRATRVYAAALLYATRDDALGRYIRPQARRWASALEVPVSTVEHYLDFSEDPWTASVPAPTVTDLDVGVDEWGEFIRHLDSILARGRLQQPDELASLQAEAVRLSAAMRWAVEEPELRPVIQLLELERGRASVETLLGGKSAAGLQAPAWVSDNRQAMQSLFAMVQTGKVSVPSPADKSLRQALSDLATLGAPASAAKSPAVKLPVNGKVEEYQPGAWAQVLSASRSAFYVSALVDSVQTTRRSLFFTDVSSYPDVPPSRVRGLGPSASIAGRYTQNAFDKEIRGPLDGLDEKLTAAKVPDAQRAALQSLIQRELETYASGLGEALFAYLKSFQFSSSDVSLLQTSVAEIIQGSSWFTEFWANLASSASIDAGNQEALRPLRRAVAPFAPVVALMTEDKGTYPNLKPYNTILGKLLPALKPEPLGSNTPQTGALSDRLPPIGKLGLALLDSTKPGPLQQVDDWLTQSNLVGEAFRVPFRAPVLVVYAQALGAVEQVAGAAYDQEIRPMVSPLFEMFPFDPISRTDAPPDDVQAVLSPKGTLLTAFDTIYGPLTVTDAKQRRVPRRAEGFRSVALSRDALALWQWAAQLSTLLWDKSSKPKAMTVALRPIPLPAIRTGADATTTLGVLRSGSTAVAAFNQTSTWKALPVEWWTASPATLSIQFTSLDGTSQHSLSTEASGAAWRFFHLLCRGRWSGAVVSWSLDRSAQREVAFELRSDPWLDIVPPSNSERRCSGEVPRR